MRDTLISANPPHFTAASTGAGGEVRTSSHVGNARLRLANATAEVASVVFWERMVPTSESRTDLRAGAAPGVAGALVPWRMVYGVSGAGSARVPGPI